MCGTINLITHTPDTINSVYVLSVSLIPYTIALVCQSLCNGFERLGYVAISQMIGNVFKMVVGTLVLMKGYGIVPLMWVILVGHCLIAIISLYFAFKCIEEPIRKMLKIDLGFCKWILASTPVFAIIMILGSIRLNIDVLILNSMLGERDVGLYSAANKLVNIFKLGISCYIMAIQPVIFRVFVASVEKFKEMCNESIRYLFIIFIPITIATIILSKRFILIVYPEAFLPSAEVLSILIWLLLFYGLNQIFANALVSSNNQKINLWANVIGMIANIVLNVLLIPRLTYVGAAISSVVSAFAAFAFQHYFISKNLFKIGYLRLCKKPLLAAVLMGIFVFSFKNINMAILVPTSALTFVVGLVVVGAITPQDRDLLKKLWTGERDQESSSN
jgi:O-antigen/teichoic acid export membrane protein